eukprot:gene4170-27864_t
MEKVKGFFSSTVEPLLPVSAPAEGEGAGAAAAGDEQEGEGGSEGGSSMFSSWVGGDDAEPDPWFPSMTRKQRLLGFVCCITVSIFCFSLACMFLPVIVLKARKFSLLFSMGSLASLGSLAMLRGPGNFAKFLLTRERAPHTLFYLGTLFATLYCAMGLKQTIPTIVAAALQFAVVLSYFSAYVPGGMFGLRMLAKLWWTTMKNVVYPCCSACAKRLVS